MVKLLLFSKKRIIPLLVALCMIVSFCSAPMVSYAKTWTKSSIKKEISAKQKKYNSIKKKYNKEVKKAKNTIALITAEKLSSSPLVCYNDGFLGIGRGYYYIIGGKKNLLTYPSVSGTVKPTGKTKKWGGHTCTVCKGVKLKSSTYKKQMDKLKKQINKLKSAQKYQPSFDEKMSYFEFVGSKFDYNECVYIDDYNKINSWKSSYVKLCIMDLSLTPPGRAKAIRTYQLGDYYMPNSIDSRITETDMSQYQNDCNPDEDENYKAIFKYEIWYLSKPSSFIPYKHLSKYQQYYVRKMLEARRLYKGTGSTLQMRERASTAIKGMSEDASFICRMNIRSEKELHRMIEDLSEEYGRTKKSTSGQIVQKLENKKQIIKRLRELENPRFQRKDVKHK